ncbi:MAG: histidine phosphatase family protein [Candidatus Pacearchaeota archaeon]|jgi:2,3-bisphosphoglycerate-dependent phosphoglycerate mutase
MRCYIYLFRHGVTPDNAEGIFCGWRNVGLNKKGIRDAKIVSLRLKNKKIGLAFESSLLRSKQTLKEVLKFHPECKEIIEDDRIIERRYGNLQGKTHLNIVENQGYRKYDLWHRGYENRPPGGESLKDVEKRVMSFIKDLLRIMKKKKINIAISAHGNSMRAFRKYFEKLSVKEMCVLYNDYEVVFEYPVNV